MGRVHSSTSYLGVLSRFHCQVFRLPSLRLRMFWRREYCDRISHIVGSPLPVSLFLVFLFLIVKPPLGLLYICSLREMFWYTINKLLSSYYLSLKQLSSYKELCIRIQSFELILLNVLIISYVCVYPFFESTVGFLLWDLSIQVSYLTSTPYYWTAACPLPLTNQWEEIGGKIRLWQISRRKKMTSNFVW